MAVADLATLAGMGMSRPWAVATNSDDDCTLLTGAGAGVACAVCTGVGTTAVMVLLLDCCLDIDMEIGAEEYFTPGAAGGNSCEGLVYVSIVLVLVLEGDWDWDCGGAWLNISNADACLEPLCCCCWLVPGAGTEKMSTAAAATALCTGAA